MTIEESIARITGPLAPAGTQSTDLETVYREVIRRRRSGVDTATAESIRRKIQRALDDEAPLQFAVPFGGYKAWHQPSFPHLNWAEVMWLDHLRRFGARVNSVFGHGVVISLSYYSAALDLVNNLPAEDQRIYIGELQAVVRQLSSPSVRLELVDLVTLHGSAEQFREDLLRAVHSQGPPDEAFLTSARRNLLPTGVVDLRADWEQAVIRSARSCAAMTSLPQRRDFNKNGPRIQIVHVRGPALSLHLGSTRTTTLHPWVGSGLLVRHRTGALLESVRTDLTGTESIPVSHPLDAISGLDRIPVTRQ